MGRARTAGPQQFPKLAVAVPSLISDAFRYSRPASGPGTTEDLGHGFSGRLGCRTGCLILSELALLPALAEPWLTR